MTVLDDTGFTLRLQAPARRVVPLYGAVTELVAAMGLEARLAGRTAADAGVAELGHLMDLPSVGTHLRPNEEVIVGLRPDLVIQVLGRQDSLEQVSRMRKLDLPVLAFRLDGLDDVLRLSRVLGRLLGSPERGEELAADLERRLDAVAALVGKSQRRPRVLYEVRSPNLLAAGKDSLVDDIIRRAGGDNAVMVRARVVRLNEEEVLRLDPDVYLYQRGPMNPEPLPLRHRPRLSLLRAVREGRVLEVDETLFSRPGPRAVTAVEQLHAFLRTCAGTADE